MIEIIITERTNQKFMVEFEDINNVKCGISLETPQCMRINKKTNIVEIDTGVDLPTMVVKDKIYINLDLMVFGRLYDLSISEDEEYNYIKCIFK